MSGVFLFPFFVFGQGLFICRVNVDNAGALLYFSYNERFFFFLGGGFFSYIFSKVAWDDNHTFAVSNDQVTRKNGYAPTGNGFLDVEGIMNGFVGLLIFL